jgi:SAM-dependent methyltransferase
MRPGRLVEYLDHRWYPDYTDNWDDALLRRRILSRLTPSSTILDLGAGAGIVTAMNFRGLAVRVCGVDPDPRVATNPHLDEAAVGTGEAIPHPAERFDLVFADNVFEHLVDPQRVLHEVHRVLRPGGLLILKTPNKWHYMPLIARLTPHAFHSAYNRLRGRAAADTFPTQYRANSRRTLRRLAAECGFAVESLAVIEGRPEYLRVSAFTYLFGLLYERAVNATPLLEGARIVLLAELRKPRASAAPG